MINRNSWALVAAGVFLALGMVASASILGQHLGGGKKTISVKGLAEKPIRADMAEWSVGLQVQGERFGDTLEKLRQSRPVVDEFLVRQGFEHGNLTEGDVEITPRMVEETTPKGDTHTVQRGFVGNQRVLVRSKDLARVAGAYKAVLQLAAEGKPVVYDPPSYLVSDLEAVKMSLIGAATRNARQRADEFAKVGNARVGAMRSASQGAFYILAANANSDANDYGGAYDKSTVEKKARVVVTIDYGIE
jgi:uncharacterized protein